MHIHYKIYRVVYWRTLKLTNLKLIQNEISSFYMHTHTHIQLSSSSYLCLCASFIIIKAKLPVNIIHPKTTHKIAIALDTAFLILLRYSFFTYTHTHTHANNVAGSRVYTYNNNNKSARRQNLHYTIYLLYPQNLYEP